MDANTRTRTGLTQYVKHVWRFCWCTCMSLFYIDSMCIPIGDEWLLTANFYQSEDEPPEPSATPVTACPDGSVAAAAPTVAAVTHLCVLHANSQWSESPSGMCRWRLWWSGLNTCSPRGVTENIFHNMFWYTWSAWILIKVIFFKFCHYLHLHCSINDSWTLINM